LYVPRSALELSEGRPPPIRWRCMPESISTPTASWRLVLQQLRINLVCFLAHGFPRVALVRAVLNLPPPTIQRAKQIALKVFFDCRRQVICVAGPAHEARFSFKDVFLE